MLKVCCNICQCHLKDTPVNGAHFCERCAPYQAEFTKVMTGLYTEMAIELKHRANKLREQFLRQIVIPGDKQRELKVI